MPIGSRNGVSITPIPPRPREGMSATHCEDVGGLPCIVCGRAKPYVMVHAHHLQRSLPPNERGTGRKASDQYTIPLCGDPTRPPLHHDEAEAGGDDEAWLAQRGIQGRDVAREIWRRRGKPKEMRDYVIRHLFNRGIYNVE